MKVIRAIELRLPYPPTVNTYWTLVRRGKMVAKILSKRGREYKESVKKDCKAQLKKHKPFGGQLRVRILAVLPDRRKRDLDNIFKSLFDAMEYSEVFVDDVQIYYIEATKRYPGHTNPGYVDITVEEALGDED